MSSTAKIVSPRYTRRTILRERIPDTSGRFERRTGGESTVPGLYICGSLARFNRRCAFIHGFRNYIEKVFWDIADRL